MKKLFIGKLSFNTTEATLRNLFASYEPLTSLKIVTDKFSGDSRGFAFIEIDNDDVAEEAVKALNGAKLDGQTIIVNEARPPTEGSRPYGNRSDSRDSSGPKRSNYRPSSNSRY